MKERRYSLISGFGFPLFLIVFGLIRLRMVSGLPKLYQFEGELGEVRGLISQCLDWQRLISLFVSVVLVAALALVFNRRKKDATYWIEAALSVGALLISVINP